jgi:hypothetical protein
MEGQNTVVRFACSRGCRLTPLVFPIRPSPDVRIYLSITVSPVYPSTALPINRLTPSPIHRFTGIPILTLTGLGFSPIIGPDQ